MARKYVGKRTEAGRPIYKDTKTSSRGKLKPIQPSKFKYGGRKSCKK